MKKSLAISLLTGVLFATAGCDSDPSGSGPARLSVLLTDAPGDFASAEVEIEEIYLLGSGQNDDEDAGPGGKVVLFSGSRTFDLLELRNGVTAQLADVAIAEGNYHELRLVLGNVSITTNGGTTYSTEDNTLKCPSCSQSGLKVKLPAGGVELNRGDQTIIVDFDVAQSFGHAAGNSGRWIMHPVIRATKVDATGGIFGTVTLADGVTLPTCGGAPVTIAQFVPTATLGELVISAATEVDGDLIFSFVVPGIYTMGYTSEVLYDNGDKLAFTATPSVTTATIGSGGTFDVDYTITGATCTLAPPPAPAA